jgi:RND family efflux transporter MFP subunit
MPRPPRLPLLALLPILLAACGGGDETAEGTPGQQAATDKGEGATTPRVVRTVTVETGKTADWSAVGTVRARHEAEIGFRVGGELVARADAGDTLEAGELLARLDDSDLRREYDAAAARAAEAEARALFARSEVERLADLVADENVSEQAYDRAESEAEAATRAAEAARAEQALAANRLDYATLRAPAEGTVMEVLAEPGEVLGTGEPVVRFARGDREVEVAIPAGRRDGELKRARLPGGDRVELRDLAAGADPATRTWRARYTLPEGAADHPLGSTLRLTFRPAEPVVRVPAGAVVDDGQGTAVWAVVDGAVERRSVEVVALGQESTEVRGLEPGTEVVAAGTHTLQPGQAVRVRTGR